MWQWAGLAVLDAWLDTAADEEDRRVVVEYLHQLLQDPPTDHEAQVVHVRVPGCERSVRFLVAGQFRVLKLLEIR